MTDLAKALVGLRDATRRRILASFYAADGLKRTVDQVASEVGVHRTVAFQHLELLASAGFLELGSRRGHPGKPAKTYRLLAGPVTPSLPSRRFGELTSLLASALVRNGPAGIRAAQLVGRDYGRELASGANATSGALRKMGEAFGADYRYEGGAIRAVPCVFKEPCGSARAAVCAAHAAIIEGVLLAAGLPCVATPLVPGEGGCGFSIKKS